MRPLPDTCVSMTEDIEAELLTLTVRVLPLSMLKMVPRLVVVIPGVTDI